MFTITFLLTISTLAFLTHRYYNSYTRLAHIPGPFLAKLSAAWMIKTLSSGRVHENMLATSAKYGPLVRIGPNDLLCTDPETLRRMSAVRSAYTKGVFYETGRIIPGCNNIVCERDENKHKALRAKMAGAYNGRENGITGFEESIDRQLMSLVALIEKRYVSTPGKLCPFDLCAKTHFFSLDVISDASFGKAFGFLVKDRDLHQFIEINDSAVPIMNILQAVPSWTNIIYRWPFNLALPKDGDGVGFGRLMGLAKGSVEERLRPDAKPGRDMLQAFINGGMAYDELVQHMFVQIVAGSITTAAAIRHTFLALTSTPPAYAALQKEIDESVSSNRVNSRPAISDAEVQALPYLQAVIREGLRMWPPVTGLGSKQVPKGGDNICGYQVPEGTQVSHNYSGIMRLKDIFGEDADVFRPERWLEAEGNEEQLKAMNCVLELAFGNGKYQCLGKRIALMEMNKIFFELLQRYDLALIDPQNPIKSSSGVFWIGSDLLLRLTKR
ncbi:cytochrome P450 [Triangularia setosa]|uniref:Cytochrome P450 n=1 Tax=Triangularia setosa TaxID=2587417 RepID=A0AAN6W6C4_9PEZI|nr:cytochrome P450 [Podospora setosa]